MWLSDAVVRHVSEVSDEPDLSGTKYELVRCLGRGGMGAVYVARDTELEREVALKVSSHGSDTAGLAERLSREVRVLAQIEHPGIVPVHDVGVLPDRRVYYVMKLVRGERLDQWSRRQKDHRSALRPFQRICEAVAFAHAHGVIHRDLKPQNVMVGEFGEPLVMDWGTAKYLGRSSTAETPRRATRAQVSGADAHTTAAGTLLGTPAYMSPEQARGDIEGVDGRSDVYGLGALLYFLLAHRPPFADQDGDVVRQVLEQQPIPLREVAPEIPASLVAICAKAMEKTPEARYPDVAALHADLGRFLDGESVTARPENIFERATRFARRNQVALFLFTAYLSVRALLFALSR